MSARSAISSDHDELLERVLPHVDSSVVSKARHAIAQEVYWDDADSFGEDPGLLELRRGGAGSRLSSASTSHRSAHARTSSTSEFSEFTYAGRSTLALDGLSPPRRPVHFANFDSGFAEMVEGGPEDDMPTQSLNGSGGGGGGARQVPPETLMEPVEVARRTGSRASQAAVAAPAGVSSPKSRAREENENSQGPFDVPARQSSRGEGKYANGHGGASVSVKELVGSGRPRRSSVIMELAHDDDEEHDASDNDERNTPLQRRATAKKNSGRMSPVPLGHETSSTPPPISHVRPTRMLMVEDFENGAGAYDGIDHGWDDDDLGMMRGLGANHGMYEQPRKPPLSSRNRDKQLNNNLSHDKDRMRGASERSGSSRTTTLTQNYRDLRTPMLNHLQLYQDAESRKRPGLDRAALDDRAARQGSMHSQKQYRSHDDGLHNGYAHDPYSRSMSLRRTYSDDDISIRQRSISGRTTGSGAGAAGGGGGGSQSGATAGSAGSMPDFFSASVFQVVLHNPTTAHQLLRFAESRLCAENVEFLARVDEYRATLNTLATQMAAIHKSFISPGSANQVNVSQALLRRAHRDMKGIVNQAFPAMETVFTDLQEQIETMVYQDIYPRFVRHQVALSASRALASDRFKYQGLGDCFCLTNPNIADNPIVFASDGFVKVTGYTRPEIIPRNCRFLQGSYTDRRPIDRLKMAINERKESVELILNYKKNGDPFWNLLYVAPLFNASGKTEFFIGGQVNCSTTIHSNVDVMKVLSLSASGETAEQENESLRGPAAAAAAAARQQLQQPRPSARRTLLRAFGVVRQDDPVPVPRGPVDTGMEDGVLGRMQGQDLTGQMKEFYTAYSRYLVVRATSYTIEFYSEGLVESLNPAATSGTMVEGSDVFRFLGLNMIARQTEYRTRVKNAMRAGIPVSTALRLQTRRSAVFRGDEAFVAHWTPLKDEQAAPELELNLLARGVYGVVREKGLG